MEEQEDQSLRANVNQKLGCFFSEIQQRHNEQLALLEKLRAQLDKAHSSVLDSQFRELNQFREMKRLIEWKIESAERSSDDDAEPSDAAVA